MLCPLCHRRYEQDHLFCPHDGGKLVAALDIGRIHSEPTEWDGTVIGGRYQIRGLVGKGGTGHVYLCLDQILNAPVAVKVLDAQFRGDRRAKARFLLEARSAAKIVHPSIIDVLDVGLHEGATPYIAVEFLFGESLGTYLKRESVMTPEVAIPILRHVAAGLGAAHEAGIVHRDVKPDNVFLVGEKGSHHTVKLLDFGLALNKELVGLTQVGVTVGSLSYMAPEQIMCDLPDPRTDVYGLGVVMYRMLSGHLPFPGRREKEVMAQQLIVKPLAPDLGASCLALCLTAILLKTLRKRPENRYASMAGLLADLAHLGPAREDSTPDSTLDALAANRPVSEADVYLPRTPIGLSAALALYTVLGREPPLSLTLAR